ncbi:SDR family oxidoreductase [Paraburkholderia sp. SOS3]|uniref:SDR family oxidoreductase n=1 Tax=Paraburkholderia sp. SOS3 TaxID=1926494 RepID=UPI001E31EC6A|nr:SDR family oxidoreductase [Paraburkholderia sp. SOS3]
MTNATDYAGPAAVDALIAAGFVVIAHDDAFSDYVRWDAFELAHRGAKRVGATAASDIIDVAWEMHGRVDAIISNDHFPAIQRPISDTTSDDLRDTLETLLVRPFALVRAAVPRLRRQGTGNVVMITSCRTRLPIPGAAIPDAARAAANALVRSFATELAPHAIAINAIAPNFLYSEAYYPRAVFIDDAGGREFVRTYVPVGRLGEPAEIGELIAYLASTSSRFLTRAVIDFAGGWPTAPLRPGPQKR